MLKKFERDVIASFCDSVGNSTAEDSNKYRAQIQYRPTWISRSIIITPYQNVGNIHLCKVSFYDFQKVDAIGLNTPKDGTLEETVSQLLQDFEIMKMEIVNLKLQMRHPHKLHSMQCWEVIAHLRTSAPLFSTIK